MANIDTNISNYSISELLAIINIEDENLDENEIIEKTNSLFNKFKDKNNQLATFFMNIQDTLLDYMEEFDQIEGLETMGDSGNSGGNSAGAGAGAGAGNSASNSGASNSSNSAGNSGNSGNTAVSAVSSSNGLTSTNGTSSSGTGKSNTTQQAEVWYQNQTLTQSDKNQDNKITQRKQKVKVFGDKVHNVMKQEQLGTTDTFNLPVKQDVLNPNLKNTIVRFLNLDSQFRQYTNGVDSTSASYTCDLSDILKNVVKITIYSFQIPYSWYVIDTAYGNTCLWISDTPSGIVVPIFMPPGNYSQSAFQIQLNASFASAGFTFPPAPAGITVPVNYTTTNGLITLYLYDGVYNGPYGSFTITTNTSVIFYDFTGVLQCNSKCLSKSSNHFNNTLGWIMGYRVPYINVDPSGNIATALLDLNGTKYLLLALDDYNQNHVNDSLVSITQYSNVLKIPSYFSTDLPNICITPEQLGDNLQEIIDELEIQGLFDDQSTNIQNGLLIAGKYANSYSNTQSILPSAPRKLTNAQLYTINSIAKNNNNLTNYVARAPTTANIISVIPVKVGSTVPTGTMFVEFSGSLQNNNRVYFGPVDIDRVSVKLLDDKGNILNLNGLDWCCTFMCECLYQY
jgi:hypothetical protein